jgi:serine acetyltransferase
MPGVRIGTGAVIGARAVVTKDVPDYGVAVGVPAKVIRLRFSQTEIQGLRHLAWWDWSHELLAQALPDFRALSIQAFLAKYL